MRAPTIPFAAAFVLLGFTLVPAVTAQELFEEFHFQELKFQLWPSGLENRQETDGKGSAITVQAVDVRIDGSSAVDLRHCIDGDSDWCPYEIPATGNNDGMVDEPEVSSFESLVQVGIRREVEKVDSLLDTLEKNVTVDGLGGKNSRITKASFEDAEGDVDDNSTIIADLEAKVTYDNDADAKKHTIKIGSLPLRPDGFVYTTVSWTLAGEGWKFDAGATQPNLAKVYVKEAGYTSPQSQFENLSTEGIELTAQKGGSKRSPGFETLAVLAVLSLAALLGVARRN